MNILIIAVGKLRQYYREAADDYAGRLSRYAKVTEHEVREASKSPNSAIQRKEEAARLAAWIPESSTVVALTREGASWTSRELARRLENWRLEARPLALLIGGPEGLDQSLIERASASWSLGPLTLPHELARVVVVEQVYRAFTILGGKPYHKERVSSERWST